MPSFGQLKAVNPMLTSGSPPTRAIKILRVTGRRPPSGIALKCGALDLIEQRLCSRKALASMSRVSLRASSQKTITPCGRFGPLHGERSTESLTSSCHLSHHTANNPLAPHHGATAFTASKPLLLMRPLWGNERETCS